MLVQQGNLTGDGRMTVARAGTAAQVSGTATRCKWVTITALPTNTQQINVGSSTVLATAGRDTGKPLTAGESVTVPATDLSRVYIDARVNGEGATYLYGN